jgi:hypothetical protein
LKKPEIIDAHFTVVGAKAVDWRKVIEIAVAIVIGVAVHRGATWVLHLVWPLQH